jgi:hypothetical protein
MLRGGWRSESTRLCRIVEEPGDRNCVTMTYLSAHRFCCADADFVAQWSASAHLAASQVRLPTMCPPRPHRRWFLATSLCLACAPVSGQGDVTGAEFEEDVAVREPDVAKAADNSVAPTCPWGTTKSDGNCCALGEAWSGAACVRVGPPDCLDPALVHEACAPRWC